MQHAGWKTGSRNITIRSLMYLSESYSRYLHQTEQDFYADKPVRLPKPEVYMLYTGDTAHTEKELSLADVYWGGDGSVLDLKVKILYGTENNSILSQYVEFTRIYKDCVHRYGKTREAVIQTLKECKREGVLVEYITKHEGEVVNIMTMLYDRDTYMKAYERRIREEAREEAREETEEKDHRRVLRMHENGLSIQEIAENMELSLDTVKKWISGAQPVLAEEDTVYEA